VALKDSRKQSPALNSARKRRQASERRAKDRRQKIIAALLLPVVVINLLLGYWLYGLMVEDVQKQRLKEQTRAQTEQRVTTLNNYLEQLNQRLSLAASDPQLPALLVFGSERELQLKAQSLSALFPNSLAVRLIPRGSAERVSDHPAPIGFAELNLIRRAEQRESSLPEIALVEGEHQLHLITGLPPASEAPAVGSLMVTLDDSGLQERLTSFNHLLGQTRLIQSLPDGSQMTVHQQGAGGAGPDQSLRLAGSHWEIHFSPSQQLVRQTRELPTLWLLAMSATSIGGLLLAWLAGHFVTQRRATGFVPEHIRRQPAATASKARPDADEEQTTHVMANPLYQDRDILDLDVEEDDEDILGLHKARTKTASSQADTAHSDQALPELPSEIFRSYDIRGLANEQLSPELARHLGLALGSEAQAQGETHMFLARDGRNHSQELAQALQSGLTASGCHVIDLGQVPTPLLYFATHYYSESSSGVMVTASHNPAEYNGFKMVINGTTLFDDAILDLRSRIQRQQYRYGQGDVEQRDPVTDYIERIFSDVALMGSVSLVIDAGNAVPGLVAPRLFEELGCEVTPLYCELDGNFPNHDPDPSREANLQDLIAKVQEVGADLGAALDGDGDRLVLVTPKGQIIWPDQLLMLFARDVLTRNPGADVLFDVKCSRQLNQVISSYGGRPVMWKTGHSHMKSKMIETGALIGGEYSGHIFIKDRWYGFDDGLYTLARLLEIITLRDQGIEEAFEDFPILPATPELKVQVPNEAKFDLVERLIKQGEFQSGKITTIDGLRVDFAKGWGLVRASNTSAALTLRFEGESEEVLKQVQQLFKRELLKIDSSLQLDF